MNWVQSFILVFKKTKEMSGSFSRYCFQVGINSVFTLAVTIWLIGLTSTVQATGKGKMFQFNIQTEEVGEALNNFAVQSDSEILFSSDIVKDKQTRGLDGEYTSEEALDKLLEGTGLKAEETKEKVYLIHEASAAGVMGLAVGGQRGEVADGEPNGQGSTNETSESSHKWMEEIIVTGTKRSENIQDTAMSIVALSNEEIEKKGLVSMRDYLSSIPGVNLLDFGVGSNQIVMRGIGISAYEQSTVSTYFGEIPLTNPARNQSTDLKLVDIERIEILRGPQGTLYGSGAMGGTIRNIPVAPDLAQFEGYLDMGYFDTAHSSDDSSSAVGVINVPLIKDQLALRVAAYRYDEAGHLDMVSDPDIEAIAVATGSKVKLGEDVDDRIYEGARASLLWQPMDDLAITLTKLTQDLKEGARPEVRMTMGGYQARSLDTGKEYQADKFDMTNLQVDYKLDWGTLIISSTHYDGSSAFGLDIGRILPWAIYAGNPLNSKKTSSQEVRLVSQLPGSLQFVAGLYYENFENKSSAFWEWTGDLDLMPGYLGSEPIIGTWDIEWHVQQKAVFSEISYQFNDQWEFVFGGRWFDYDRRDIADDVFASVATQSDLTTDEQGFNPKVNIKYTPNDNMLVYAQWAQGYRVGKGISIPAASVCDTDGDGFLDFTNTPLDPGPLNSDTTENIELGGKFALLDGRLIANTALYHINWKDIPITVNPTTDICKEVVYINSGEALSQGVELDVSYFLTSNLQFTLSVSYIDAEFVSDTVVKSAVKGDRLPLSPRVNGNVSIQYDFELTGLKSFVRLDYGYLGKYLNDVSGNTPKSGGYGKLNMRLGLAFDQFNIEVYGNNLTNEDSQTMVFPDARGWRLPPRTVGLNVRYRF